MICSAMVQRIGGGYSYILFPKDSIIDVLPRLVVSEGYLVHDVECETFESVDDAEEVAHELKRQIDKLIAGGRGIPLYKLWDALKGPSCPTP